MIKRCILLVLTASFIAAAAPIQWKVADGGNGHYYEYFQSVSIFDGLFSFDTAKANAESSTYLGLSGYLLTVTSEAENEFIRTSFPFLLGFGNTSSLWLAASDALTDGQFRWVSGPESGQLLNYTNFSAGQPQGAGVPNYLAMIINAQGSPTTALWQTYATSGDRTFGYIVEYGNSNANQSAVPEPASWAMAAGALLCLTAARSRWSRNSSH